MREYPADGPPTDPEADAAGPPVLSLATAADLQDHLMVATHDLERLQVLLTDACDTLMHRFYAVMDRLRTLDAEDTAEPAAVADAIHEMAGAVTALQFQDLASQLIDHTTRRLRTCSDRLARETMGDDEDGDAVVEAAPLRPNPVTQAEMDAGSVELF